MSSMTIFLVSKKRVTPPILSLNSLTICFSELESNCLSSDINFLASASSNISKSDSPTSDALSVPNILLPASFTWVIERLSARFTINILGSASNTVCAKTSWFLTSDKSFTVHTYEIWFPGSKLMRSVKGKTFPLFRIPSKVKGTLCAALFFAAFFNPIRSGSWACSEGLTSSRM